MPDDSGAAEHAYALLELDERLIHARAVQIIAELGIADLLSDGPRSSDDIAAATSCDPDACHRMLRMLAACGLFTETEPHTFGLTAQGGPLRSDHPCTVRSTLRLNGTVVPLVVGGVEQSLRTGRPTLPAVLGESFHTYLERAPGHADLFDTAMAELTHLMLPALLEAYEFAGRLVDVGAGTGTLLRGVLRATSDTSGVVFDTPRVAERAREAVRLDGLMERCAVVSGDFFTEVPRGGDIYLLKRVLHDWPDEPAGRILEQCRRSMPATARLLVIESLLPTDSGGTGHPTAATMDMSMLVVEGGRERTEEQYTRLLTAAGLRLDRRISTGSPYSILEARPA